MSNCQSRASPPPTPERTSRAMEPSLFFLLLLLLVSAVSMAMGANGSPAPDGGLSYNASTCHKPFTCGPNVDIHYPFHLANESSTKVLNGTPSSSYCGYPGMAILCSANNTATLHLGIGDDDASYAVLGIDYVNKTITLAAPDLLLPSATCPRVNRNVTIPQSPASMLELSAADTGYLSFFFGCAFTDRTIPPGIVPINCTGFHDGSLQSYVVPTADTPQGGWFVRANCNEVYVAPVLKRLLLSPEFYKRLGSDQGFGEVLRQGFRLTWDPSAGPCVECERSMGQCSYDQGGGFLGCLCSDGRVRSPDCGAKKQDTKAIDIGLPVAAAVLLLLLLVVSFLYIRKRRQYRTTSSSRLLKHTAPSGGTPRSRCSSNDGLESGGSVHSLPTHLFAYEELQEATDGFSAALELGDGGFGTVYKGQLRDGRVVAVKRLYNKSGCRHVEKFVNEAAILSRLRHPSLVTFYGCTSSRSRELLLVCEHVPNGTVADHLHGPRAPERALPWPVRLRVAVEAASALGYLHAVDPPVVHRDVKTGNILLDAEFHVKVADFGLSRELQLLDGAGNAAHAVSTAPQGTPGYVDPEYHRCYRLTDRSDVYSFGVVLAELVSSKPAVDVARDRGDINLAAMAVDRVQRGLVGELVDQEVWCASHGETRRMATMVAELAFRCLQQDGEMRPPIREVLDVLRGIQREGGKVNGVPRSPDTVHAPWDSRTTTPSVSQ